jgi:hypothetical protein
MDANGDGIYSTDLMLENPCTGNFMTFGLDGKVSSTPEFARHLFKVETDSSGVNFQTLQCDDNGAYTALDWNLDINILTFSYQGQLDNEQQGLLSDDGNTITFFFADAPYYWSCNGCIGGPWEILNPDNSISTPTGTRTIVYTRQ